MTKARMPRPSRPGCSHAHVLGRRRRTDALRNGRSRFAHIHVHSRTPRRAPEPTPRSRATDDIKGTGSPLDGLDVLDVEANPVLTESLVTDFLAQHDSVSQWQPTSEDAQGPR